MPCHHCVVRTAYAVYLLEREDESNKNKNKKKQKESPSPRSEKQNPARNRKILRQLPTVAASQT